MEFLCIFGPRSCLIWAKKAGFFVLKANRALEANTLVCGLEFLTPCTCTDVSPGAEGQWEVWGMCFESPWPRIQARILFTDQCYHRQILSVKLIQNSKEPLLQWRSQRKTLLLNKTRSVCFASSLPVLIGAPPPPMFRWPDSGHDCSEEVGDSWPKGGSSSHQNFMQSWQAD